MNSSWFVCCSNVLKIKKSQRNFNKNAHRCYSWLQLNIINSLNLVARAACHIELFLEAETRKFNLHFLSKQLSPHLAGQQLRNWK